VTRVLSQLVQRFPVLRPAARFVRYRLMGHRDEQWCRVVMNEQTLALVRSQVARTTELDALEISGGRWQDLLPFGTYQSTAHTEYDVCDAPLPRQFDFIAAEQVFEHLKHPYRAGRNVHAMLRSGGHFLVTTPFLLKVHRYPIDCTRWTEEGLRYFLEECGFPADGILTGSWGNRACVVGNFEEWTYYNRWRHSLANEPDFPIAVWAIARK
jgi:hypothetical protein